MRDIRYGACGSLTDVAMNRMAAQMFESQGYDFMIWPDQMGMTIPRSIWTPDIAPGAEVFDIDMNFDAWTLCADAAGHSERINLGITVNDAIRRGPANYAQMALTMDHLSQGRYFHGMGAGEIRHFKPYGLARNKPFTHLEESIKIQKMLMDADGPVSYEGPIWSLDKAVMTAMPYGDKRPPILVAGGGRAMKIAAEHADGWITMLPAAGDPDHYGAQVRQIKRWVEEAGRDPEKFRFYALILGLICADDDETEAVVNHPLLRFDAISLIPDANVFNSWGIIEHPIRPDYNYSRDIISTEWSREATLAVIDKVPSSVVRRARACGTPKQVADQLQPYIDAGLSWLNIINYAAFVGSGNFADSAASLALVTETVRLLRERNGQPIPEGMLALAESGAEGAAAIEVAR